jgi:hypothetical protein
MYKLILIASDKIWYYCPPYEKKKLAITYDP